MEHTISVLESIQSGISSLNSAIVETGRIEPTESHVPSGAEYITTQHLLTLVEQQMRITNLLEKTVLDLIKPKEVLGTKFLQIQ